MPLPNGDLALLVVLEVTGKHSGWQTWLRSLKTIWGRPSGSGGWRHRGNSVALCSRRDHVCSIVSQWSFEHSLQIICLWAERRFVSFYCSSFHAQSHWPWSPRCNCQGYVRAMLQVRVFTYRPSAGGICGSFERGIERARHISPDPNDRNNCYSISVMNLLILQSDSL